MKRKRFQAASLIALILLVLLSGAIFYSPKEKKFVGVPCWNRKYSKNEEQERLVIYSSHPIYFMRPLLEEFEEETGIQTEVVTGGSGELLDRMETEQESPNADILWGGSLSTLTPQKYLFENYLSCNEEYLQEEFRNKEGMMTRFSDVPSILIVNKDLVGSMKIEDYQDLLNPRMKGKIAFCSPSISSSAYEHLINMLYAAGGDDPEKGWEYVTEFCDNLDGTLLKSSKEVYQGVEAGEYVVGLTFEEAAASMVAEGENIGIVYMKEGVISTPDCVCIARNAKHMDHAKRFVDFVTGFGAQNLLSNQLHRRSVRTDVELPDYLAKKEEFLQLQVDRDFVEQKRQNWLVHFREIFYEEDAKREQQKD